MVAHLLRGDARRLPLATGSVQCVVTSPPYFGLRQYSTNPVIWGGQEDCEHEWVPTNGKVLTGGTGAASKKQVTNRGSQFGNERLAEPNSLPFKTGSTVAVHQPGKNSASPDAQVNGVTAGASVHRGLQPALGKEGSQPLGECQAATSESGPAGLVNVAVSIEHTADKVPGDSIRNNGESTSEALLRHDAESGQLPYEATAPDAPPIRDGAALGSLLSNGCSRSDEVSDKLRAALIQADETHRPSSDDIAIREHQPEEVGEVRTPSFEAIEGNGVGVIPTSEAPVVTTSHGAEGIRKSSSLPQLAANGSATPDAGQLNSGDSASLRAASSCADLGRLDVERPVASSAVDDRHNTPSICQNCGAIKCELGSEPTPALFVAHLVEVMRECWRVLRDDGVCFLNIGDSYSGGGGFDPAAPSNRNGSKQSTNPGTTPYKGRKAAPGTRQKSLLLVPERLAIALSDDGWVIRQVLIWAKNNPMPESVRDRWTTAHEYVLMLVKQPRYFFDAAGIAEPATSEHDSGNGYHRPERLSIDGRPGHEGQAAPWTRDAHPTRNGRSVWNVNTTGYPGAHYAVFSPEIPRRCILAATSEYGACAACGAAYRRTTERSSVNMSGSGRSGNPIAGKGIPTDQVRPGHDIRNGPTSVVSTTGWAASCKCGPAAGVCPCVVLDIFSGSGTTVYQAARMGRIGIGVELSESYIAQAQNGRLAQGFLPLAAPPQPAAPRLPMDGEGPA